MLNYGDSAQTFQTSNQELPKNPNNSSLSLLLSCPGL